jgi:methyl-accepting chemotaxis protein
MSIFSKFKFRIGAKLAISASIGIVLVCGMIANQLIGDAMVGKANDSANNQRHITRDAIDMKASARGMMIGMRDVRLAQTPEDVQKAATYLQARTQSVSRFADDALKLVTSKENRDRLGKIKADAAQYAGFAKQVTDAKGELFALGGKLNGNAWRAQYASLTKSPDLAKSPKIREIEAALRDASDAFNDARTAGWRYAATWDAAQATRAGQSADNAIAQLRKLRGEVEDKTLGGLIDGLAQIVADYKAVSTQYVQVNEGIITLVRDKALPTASEIGQLTDQVVDSSKKHAEHATADAASIEANVEHLLIAVGILAILVLVGTAVFGAMSIAKPIRRIAEVLLQLANGNKQVDIPYVGRGDEVGDAANAANTFKDNLIRIEKMEAAQRETEARAAEQRRADMHRLADEFQAAVGEIVNTVSSASTELEAAATSLTKTAETTQQLSTTVAAASEEASTNVHSVASATEELSSSVHEIARRVQESSEIAGEAVRQAEKTDARISELSAAAGRIGDVVNLITAVAQQTNLLALNATIEAARAGEAGKGFAVVAQEVKALAAQTAKATEEISTQIASMQTATQESVTAIKDICGTINRISEIAGAIAAAVEEQGAATQEISRNVQQAAAGTTQVASNIVEVNHGAAETGTASSQVLSSAQSLSNDSNHLKLEVEKFLTTVRAA